MSLTADGCGTAAIMRRAGVAKPSVWRWQARFMAEGVDGLLHDKTKPPAIPTLPKTVVGEVVRRTLDKGAARRGDPLDGAGDGRGQRAQRQLGAAHLAGARAAAHQVRRFKLSTDPRFAEKVEEIPGS